MAYSDNFISKRLGSLKGRALIRIDVNVPVRNGLVSENNLRFKAAAKILDRYMESGITPILISHQGRQGDSDYLESLEQHARVLNSLVKKGEVIYHDSLNGKETEDAIKRLKFGQALMLKNLRSDDDEKKEFTNDEERRNCSLVKRLGALVDFYINDAPATMHRADTSLVGFVGVKPSYLGLLIEEELEVLKAMKKEIATGKNVAIIFGGAKWEKFSHIYKIVQNNNVSVLCGGIPGQSLCYLRNKERFNKENEEFLLKAGGLETAEKLLQEFPKRILYPHDFILDSKENVRVEELAGKKGAIMDIGEETLNRFFEAIERADAIIYAGPVGVYEKGYNQTIRLVTRFMGLKTNNYTLGGNSADSMDDIGLDVAYEELGGKRITSGGSGLAYIANAELPVIKAFGGS